MIPVHLVTDQYTLSLSSTHHTTPRVTTPHLTHVLAVQCIVVLQNTDARPVSDNPVQLCSEAIRTCQMASESLLLRERDSPLRCPRLPSLSRRTIGHLTLISIACTAIAPSAHHLASRYAFDECSVPGAATSPSTLCAVLSSHGMA
jgi:hypothetical protein